jgi:mannose-1-phosphate guanylyltransferase
MSSPAQPIVPVILSGGSGTRLWPMSTPERPKQFLPLTAEATMFQLTALRARDPDRFASPIIVGAARHAELIEAQLAEIGIVPQAVILEPAARNTAPAIALAAFEAGDAPLLVMPSDHAIADEAAFLDAIEAALPLVREGWLATFGITPDAPETGYGYIRIGERLGEGVHRVERFVEKPDRARAEAMLAEGGHAWNGGIFLFGARAYLDALAVHAPEIHDEAKTAHNAATREGARLLPDPKAFAACPSDSIDYAVMEKAEKVAVAPVAMGWSDVGSWDALHGLAVCDEAGNCSHGPVRLEDSANVYIRSDGVRISALGVEDLIVIASGNEVLIVPKGHSQEVKRFSG